MQATAPDPLSIRSVRAHPLRASLAAAQHTSQGAWPSLEIVVITIETESGLAGLGECLGRRGAAAYARFIETTLAPRILGRSAHDRRALFAAMRETLTGRSGGVLLEAIAGIDIALWDLAAQAAGQPLWRVLGGAGRRRVAAYASSINWTDPETATAELAAARAQGFREIKIKLGRPVARAIAQARAMRAAAGEAIVLSADANCAFDADDALRVGRVLSDLDYAWFEEPVPPDDCAGYARLRQHLPIRLAAGEGEFLARAAAPLIETGLIGLVQPDVARAGGISETWRIAELAAIHGIAYAPHIGWSGAVCAMASLHLAAAAESFRTFECMVFANPLRQEIARPTPFEATHLEDGALAVPDTPGLGLTLDPDAVARFTIRE